MTVTRGAAIIPAPAEKVWATLRDFGGLAKWFKAPEKCEILDGLATDQIGAVRLVSLPGGGAIREVLTGLSDEDQTITYRIDAETDLGAVKAASGSKALVTVRGLTHGDGTFLEFRHQHHVLSGDPEVLHDFYKGIYDAFFTQLTAHLT